MTNWWSGLIGSDGGQCTVPLTVTVTPQFSGGQSVCELGGCHEGPNLCSENCIAMREASWVFKPFTWVSLVNWPSQFSWVLLTKAFIRGCKGPILMHEGNMGSLRDREEIKFPRGPQEAFIQALSWSHSTPQTLLGRVWICERIGYKRTSGLKNWETS